MPIEDDPIYKTYMKELDVLHSAIIVYKRGINDEIEELKVINLMREQLAEAIKFAGDGALIVSLGEFSKIKREMAEMDRQVNLKRAAIQNIEAIIKERSSHLDFIAAKISDLKDKFDNNNVLSFHKKDKQ